MKMHKMGDRVEIMFIP